MLPGYRVALASTEVMFIADEAMLRQFWRLRCEANRLGVSRCQFGISQLISGIGSFALERWSVMRKLFWHLVT